MIDATRIRALNDDPPHAEGKYVLYWMQQAQRTRFNPALEHAIIGNIVPDFPLINKSFNLSYSGHDL